MLESASIFLARCGALGITVLDLPTAYWHELVASATPDDWRQATALRLVLIAGEKATVERLRRWHQNVGSRLQLLNRYGPTEATVIATVEDLTHLTLPELATMTEVSIGRPYPNCQVYILDTELKPVPTGAPGELYIGGAGVADGYLNAPELTASRFLLDPFAKTPGARLYRTGDKVRYLAGGAIQYLGRLDQQVKIRGHRVELGEIETALAEHPGVRAAAVARGCSGLERATSHCVPRMRGAVVAVGRRGARLRQGAAAALRGTGGLRGADGAADVVERQDQPQPPAASVPPQHLARRDPRVAEESRSRSA